MNQTMIEQTQEWLEKVVVGLNLCPFAKAPYENAKIELIAGALNELEDMVETSLEKLNQDVFETSLLIFKDQIDFESFYQLSAGLEAALEEAGLEEFFQIVVFHPDFVFEGLDANDRANLVNRSPYPTIHILKTASMNALNLEPGQGEKISLANEEQLNSLTLESLQKLYPWIFKD